MLDKSVVEKRVVEKCWRRVLGKSVVEKRVVEKLERSVG